MNFTCNTLGLVVWLGLACPSLLFAEPVQAARADDFVDSIGVNTHFGYTDRPYWSKYDQVREKLVALGVRHIRDGVDTRKEVADRIRRLHSNHGICVLQGVGPRADGPHPWLGKLDAAKIDAVLKTIKTLYGDANEAIEGPNEYDITHKDDPAATTDADWPTTLRAYTAALWKKVRADPVLKDRPVVAPAMAHAHNAPKVGDLSAFISFGNMHPYPGGWNPARGLDEYNLPYTRKIAGQRQFWATETGYHNALKQPVGGHNPAPAAVAGTYGPRLVAEYFRRGFKRAYFYELLDEGTNPADPENNFGLLHNDLSEKPIFTALQQTIKLLKDPGLTFAPGKLDYTSQPKEAGIRQVLLQKRDRRFYLLLWQEAAGWDPEKRVAIPVAPKKVEVSFSMRLQRAVTYLPTSQGSKPGRRFDWPNRLELSLTDELLVVELTQ